MSIHIEVNKVKHLTLWRMFWPLSDKSIIFEGWKEIKNNEWKHFVVYLSLSAVLMVYSWFFTQRPLLVEMGGRDWTWGSCMIDKNPMYFTSPPDCRSFERRNCTPSKGDNGWHSPESWDKVFKNKTVLYKLASGLKAYSTCIARKR